MLKTKVKRNMINQPNCECGKPATYVNKNKKTGIIQWRKNPKTGSYSCGNCHIKRCTNTKKGGKDGYPSVRYKFNNEKNYCENKDGRLGFKCIINQKTLKFYQNILNDKNILLEQDHIDEFNPSVVKVKGGIFLHNHSSNDPENMQTLCVACHKVKSKMTIGMRNNPEYIIQVKEMLEKIYPHKPKKYIQKKLETIFINVHLKSSGKKKYIRNANGEHLKKNKNIMLKKLKLDLEKYQLQIDNKKINENISMVENQINDLMFNLK